MPEFTIEATARVGAKAPITGGDQYKPQDTGFQYAIGEVVEADSFEEALDLASARSAQLAELAKINTAAHVPGLTIAVDANGVTQLTFEGGLGEVAPLQTAAVATPSAPAVSEDTPQPSSVAPASSKGGFQTLSHGGDRYTVLWDGVTRTLFDNRATKTGNQPDFKMPAIDGEDKDKAFWMQTSSGGVNKASAVLAKMVSEAVPA